MVVVLISSPSGKRASVVSRFTDLGWQVRQARLGPDTPEGEVIEAIRDVDGVLAHIEPYTRRVIEGAPRLRILSRAGVGYDAIDVEAATEHRVAVCTSVGSNDRTVADYAIMLMLALARNLIPGHTRLFREGGFDRPLGVDFFGKTVGIVGTGMIGKQVAQRVRGFDCPILGYDVVTDAAFAETSGLRYVPLETLLRESDFVTLHLPLLAATHHLIGAEQLALMRPSAYLVNTARGPLVDEQALSAALAERTIAGAALDVFEAEPLAPESALRKLDNVILTPHNAGGTHEATERSGEMAAESIVRLLQGERPRSCVNPQVLPPA
ncbi:MAG: phosphoglycerate dehydrogenase [Chloroflexi bacterium]|nr:phosphoglycerate dehydrogenase [Chloroflexota bacterium]